MRDALPKRAFIWVTGVIDRRVGWYRLPEPLALPVLTGIRMKLRRTNLVDPEATPVAWGPEQLPEGPRPLTRTITGRLDDLARPDEGSAGEIFGRNAALAVDVPQNVVDPNPQRRQQRVARASHLHPGDVAQPPGRRVAPVRSARLDEPRPQPD